VHSPSEEPAWQPSTDAQALAQLRSLIRSYIRGELSHTAFVMQFGVQCLTHDLATPRAPLGVFPLSPEAELECQTANTDVSPGELLHNPSCGCDWCNSSYLGLYRGTPVDDAIAPVDE